MFINKIILTSSIALSLTAFFVGIELLFPAPKISYFCTEVPCDVGSIDRLVVARQDYYGNVVPWILAIFVVGCILLIANERKTKNTSLRLYGSLFILNCIVFLVINRFFIIFSRWPTAVWSIIVLITIISILFLMLTPRQGRTFSETSGK